MAKNKSHKKPVCKRKGYRISTVDANIKEVMEDRLGKKNAQTLTLAWIEVEHEMMRNSK